MFIIINFKYNISPNIKFKESISIYNTYMSAVVSYFTYLQTAKINDYSIEWFYLMIYIQLFIYPFTNNNFLI